MGKSPGKWIKAVLFGKKSKSGFSKNGSAEKRTSLDAKAHSGVVGVNPHLLADLHSQTTVIGESVQLGRDDSANLSSDAALLVQKQNGIVEGAAVLNSTNNEDIVLQEQAATKAQAAFRGYLARRAFRALKGIIRLQALIRGHLVRRQAVVTLHCMRAIVRVQAVVRGQQVRLSDVSCEVIRKCRSGESRKQQNSKHLDLAAINIHPRSEKLSKNVFVTKLVASLPSAKPLSLRYDPDELNSAWSWLERWSTSRFWEPLPRQKKIMSTKHQKKHSSLQTAEKEKPKRVAPRVTSVNGDGNSFFSSSDIEKSKRTHKKSLSHQTETVQDHPQSELERVKRSLRKVTASAKEGSTSIKTEAVVEKLPKSGKKSPPIDEMSEQGLDPVVAVTEQPVVEPPSKPLAVEPVETTPIELPTVEVFSSDSGEKPVATSKATEQLSSKDEESMVNEELGSTEDQSKENQKIRRRSLPGKQEYLENISQNSPAVPSYMAATESAKAKLRAQGSPNLTQEGSEVGLVRRHSLPSPANGKLISQSSRIQKPIVQANGKGGSRRERSLLSSRDGNESAPAWMEEVRAADASIGTLRVRRRK